jgi:peptidoglycan/LPS O-acetylase OafA/YrhL
MMDMALLFASMAVGVAYLCRLDGLNVRRHKVSILVHYVACFIAIANAGYHAWIQTWDVQDWAILIGCAAALIVSYSTWKNGPPKWVERGK